MKCVRARLVSSAESKKGQPLTEEGATAPISIELLLRRRVSSPDVTGRCRGPLPPSGWTQVAPKVNRFSLSRTFFNPQLMIPQCGPISQTLRVALVLIYRKDIRDRAEPYQYVNISHGKNSYGYQMQENVKICIFGEFLALLHCSQDAYCHSSAPQSRWMEFLSTSTKEKKYDYS